MNDIHQAAADEVWNAFDAHLRGKMCYYDFTLGFKLGRVSMKATMDNAELLHADDPTPDQPFTPEQTNQQNQ